MSLRFFENDLDTHTADNLITKDWLAIDTETDGLNYREHKLRLVQICTEDGRVYIVRNPRGLPRSPNLAKVLTSTWPTKVFHHAMFDLRFIKAWMRTEVAEPIECTKVLMKICHPEKKSGIKSLLGNVLKIHLPEMHVDYTKWNEPVLSNEQLTYSAGDVLYLIKAFKTLRHKMNWYERQIYKRAIKACINTAFLQVEGFTDLFDYQQNAYEVNLEQRNWWHSPRGEE